jgi:PAS domain S-box-containing protein
MDNQYKNRPNFQNLEDIGLFRCLMKTPSSLFVYIDAFGDIKGANDALLVKCGATRDQLIGRHLTSLISGDDIPAFDEVIKQLSQSSECLELEFRLKSFNGLRWSSWEFFGKKDKNNSLIEVFGLGRDISAHKLNEELLHRAEERYRATLGYNPVIVYNITLTDAPKTVYISPKIEKLLGYSQEEWYADVGLWEKCRYPDDIKNIRSLIEEETHLRDSFIIEYRMIHQQGSIIWVRDEAHIVRDQSGKSIGIQGFILDITEWKRTEEALRQSEFNNRSLLDVIPDEMYLIKSNGDIVNILERQSGGKGVFTERNVSGNLHELFPLTAPYILRYVNTALITRKLQVFEFQIPSEIQVNNYEARLIVFGKDEVVAIIRDINERVRLEQMKSDFIHRAAHELRTPLTTAILMADLIHEGGESEELSEYWEILQRELIRQRSLVERLLTMGRLENDALQFNLVPLEIKPILNEVIKTIQHIAGKKGIYIKTIYSPETPMIVGDLNALNQVFSNLIDNAVKYTPSKGEVIITVKTVDDGVSVIIEDSGIGVPDQDLPNLFKRFFRASNAEKSEIQGSGVGLYIAKSIIDNLNGRLTVQNRPLNGAEFTVWFPALNK